MIFIAHYNFVSLAAAKTALNTICLRSIDTCGSLTLAERQQQGGCNENAI